MRPTIGRIVIYHLQPDEVELNNGAFEAPAVVTRVWSDQCVNLKILFDGYSDAWKTSVSHGTGPRQFSWPERV